jgi:hypothetical protein
MTDRSAPSRPAGVEPNGSPLRGQRQRRLGVIIGAFLLVVAMGAAVALGSDVFSEPLLAVQLLALGVAGGCNLLAGIERLPMGPLAWYQWSGIGNLCLGVALPLGFAGGEPVLLAVIAIGGLSLAAMGVDMFLFHGAYTRGRRLDGS